MSLKKICRCGKIIDYQDKYCHECAVIAEKEKAERNKLYDTNSRNKESASIYHSKEWIKLTTQCKSKFKAIDIYSYFVLGQVEFGSLSHHIEEVTKNKLRVYDISNLIWITSQNHTQIHKMYEKDYEGTKKMLFGLIERWDKQFILTN